MPSVTNEGFESVQYGMNLSTLSPSNTLCSKPYLYKL